MKMAPGRSAKTKAIAPHQARERVGIRVAQGRCDDLDANLPGLRRGDLAEETTKQPTQVVA